MLPTMFGVNWLSGLGVEAKNDATWQTMHDGQRTTHDGHWLTIGELING